MVKQRANCACLVTPKYPTPPPLEKKFLALNTRGEHICMFTDQNEILYYEAEGLYDRFDHPDRI